MYNNDVVINKIAKIINLKKYIYVYIIIYV